MGGDWATLRLVCPKPCQEILMKTAVRDDSYRPVLTSRMRTSEEKRELIPSDGLIVLERSQEHVWRPRTAEEINKISSSSPRTPEFHFLPTLLNKASRLIGPVASVERAFSKNPGIER